MTTASHHPGDGTTPPRVSIILPCRNEVGHIAACLSGLMELENVAGNFEVIVADGRSNDGTRQILDQLAAANMRLRVIDNPGLTAPCGLNAAIRAAQGEIIIRVDAHTEYAPDYVVRCLETLESTGADNVGGPARTKAASYMGKAVAAAYHSPFSVGGARFHNIEYEGPVDTVTYGCWRRSAFNRFGFFDEELARNQDDEHNLRICRGGGKVWQNPQIRSWYWPRSSLSSLFRQYMQYGYWKVRVIQKHQLPASWRHLAPGAFLLSLAVLLIASVSAFVISGARSSFYPGAMMLLGDACGSAFLFAAGAYLVATFVASLITASGAGWRLLPALPFVFACYHFGYGYGFLRGFMDFVVLRHKPRASFGGLTR